MWKSRVSPHRSWVFCVDKLCFVLWKRYPFFHIFPQIVHIGVAGSRFSSLRKTLPQTVISSMTIVRSRANTGSVRIRFSITLMELRMLV